MKPNPRCPGSAAVGAAFTLVEMMVVIVLIGILAATMLREMKGTMQEARLRAVSRELINACHLTYSRAVSVGQVHRLRLDPAASRFVIEKGLGDAGPEERFLPVKDIPGCQGELDSQISVALRRADAEPEGEMPTAPAQAVAGGGRNSAITFYPDGTADRVEIKLEDRGGFRLILRLNPTTARVQVIDPAVESSLAAPPSAPPPEAVP
jgi:prepilin-type N-terminal cleavage/methylation domain-containing protein